MIRKGVNPAWMKLNYGIMNKKFTDLSTFFERSSEWVKKEQEDLDKYLKDWEEDNPELVEEGTDLYWMFEDRIHTVYNEYSNLSYYSFVLISYSYFENSFKNLCLETSRYLELEILVDDLKGSYIDQSRTFVVKLLGIKIDDLDKEWIYIKNFGRIRNIIAHRDGLVKESEIPNIETILKRYDGISVSKNQRKILMEDLRFIQGFCASADIFCKGILKKIIEKLSTSME